MQGDAICIVTMYITVCLNPTSTLGTHDFALRKDYYLKISHVIARAMLGQH